MLPEHEWLAQAKRLAVGMTTRVRHRRESRANLAIGNDPDKWWCYCHRCHEGGVVRKDHVLLGVTPALADDSELLPAEHEYVCGSEHEVAVARFLASKDMALTYLPQNVMVAPKAKRLLLNYNGSWHGRALYEGAKQKWMNYNKQTYAIWCKASPRTAVVVEDLFSMHKVQWAMHYHGNDVTVICALGTHVTDKLVAELMQYERIVWFFDNDEAGWKGAQEGIKRMRVWSPQYAVFPPMGDPKNMQCYEIYNTLKGVVL